MGVGLGGRGKIGGVGGSGFNWPHPDHLVIGRRPDGQDRGDAVERVGSSRAGYRQ